MLMSLVLLTMFKFFLFRFVLSRSVTFQMSQQLSFANKSSDFLYGLHVVKRNGQLAPVKYDKITQRIERLSYGLNREYVDPAVVSQKVCLGVFKGVTTQELDELAAETAAHLTSLHPDFGLLAARIAVSNLHKSTLKSFS